MSRKARMFITDKFDIYKFDNNSFAVCGGCSFGGLRLRFTVLAICGVYGWWLLRFATVVVSGVCGSRGLRLRFAAVAVSGLAVAVCGGCGLRRLRFAAIAVCGVCGLRRLRFAAFAVCGDCGLRRLRVFCGLRVLRFAAFAAVCGDCGLRRLRFAGFAVCGGWGSRLAVCGSCGLRRWRFPGSISAICQTFLDHDSLKICALCKPVLQSLRIARKPVLQVDCR